MTLEAKYEEKHLPDDVCEQHDSRNITILREKRDGGFERGIVLRGAHKCSIPRSDGRNHGVGSVRMTFLLIGPSGAVQWMIDTGWYTRSTSPLPSGLGIAPPGAWDLGYHSLTPGYEGQSTMGPCDWLGGKPCFYDGSGLRAMVPMPDFLTHPDTIWSVLEAEYTALFDKKEATP